MEKDRVRAVKNLRRAAFFICLTLMILCAIAWMLVFELTLLEKLIILILSFLIFLLYVLTHIFLGLAASYLKLDWFKFGVRSALSPIIGALIAYRKLRLIVREGLTDNESQYSIFFDIF